MMNRPGHEHCESVIASLEREIAALEKANFRLLNDVQWPYAQQAVIEAAIEGRLPPRTEGGDLLMKCHCGARVMGGSLYCGAHQ